MSDQTDCGCEFCVACADEYLLLRAVAEVARSYVHKPQSARLVSLKPIVAALAALDQLRAGEVKP